MRGMSTFQSGVDGCRKMKKSANSSQVLEDEFTSRKK